MEKRTLFKIIFWEYYQNYFNIDFNPLESKDNRYDDIEKIWERIENFNIKEVYSVLDIGMCMGWALNFLKRKIGDHIFIGAIEPSIICRNHIINEVGAELLTADEIEGAINIGLKVIEFNNYLRTPTRTELKIEKFSELLHTI